MRQNLIHPLWTHLPAVVALIVLVVYAFTGGQLPDSVPLHFDNSGQPDAYGSPWSFLGLMVGLSIFFILLSSFFDELWARQEKKKAFNWLSLMDEIAVGAMVGIGIGHLNYIYSNDVLFSFPWSYLGLILGGATILGVLLEIARPYRPYSGKLVGEEGQALESEITNRLKVNTPFVFWDYQNPLYISLLTTILPLVMIATGVFTWFEQTWVSIIMFVVAVLLILPYGGQRVLVTRRDVTIRWGLTGFRVMRLMTEEISKVEKHEFSPLRDFGGYGIRINREMKAYYLRGNHGVKLTTTSGKKYLIGSDKVDRLASVISLVSTGH